MSDLQTFRTAPAIAELASLDQWVISKPVEGRDKDGNLKWDKPPFSPIIDGDHRKPWKCSHSNPAHWASYDAARAALAGFSWLGFVFHESDPYSGIDLDGCRDKVTGAIEDWAQTIIDQAAADAELSKPARRQLDIHLTIAGTRGWHRASVARQAELAGVGERAVQFANQELIERGYLTRELTSGTTTAIWTFTPRSPVEMSEAPNVAPRQDAQNDAGSPVLVLELDLIPTLELVSGAPPAQPEAWELWEACDSESCGYDLELETPQIAVFEPESEPIETENVAVNYILEAPQPAEHPGGASYSPERDFTAPRHRGRPPTERAAYAKSRRQARFKAMDAPTLRREWIVLSRKADKTANPSQRYALKEQVAELEHYLALKDAELDRVMAPPVLPPPHKLAPEGRPLTLAMDLSQHPPPEGKRTIATLYARLGRHDDAQRVLGGDI